MSELHVSITLTLDDAERISNGLSDLLCWVRGYMAASKDDPNGPFGQDEARDLHIRLKRAWSQAEKLAETGGAK